MAWKSYIITTTIADAGTSRPGRNIGEMTYYHNSPLIITIDHTEVSEKLKGTGSGKNWWKLLWLMPEKIK